MEFREEIRFIPLSTHDSIIRFSRSHPLTDIFVRIRNEVCRFSRNSSRKVTFNFHSRLHEVSDSFLRLFITAVNYSVLLYYSRTAKVAILLILVSSVTRC